MRAGQTNPKRYLSLFLLLCSLPRVWSQTQAISFTGGSGQLFPGYTVGWAFTVSNSIVVRSLGWYDAGTDGLLDSHEVAIFTFPSSDTGTLLLSATVDGSSLLTNSYWYTSVTPTTLSPGNYVIVGTTGGDAFQAFCGQVVTPSDIKFLEGQFVETDDDILTYPNRSSDRGIAYFGPNFLAVFNPVITNQPKSIVSCLASTATFSVGARGTAPFSYQWYFGNSLLDGQTNAQLVLTNLQPMNGGLYSVVVSNEAGMMTSSNAQLVVNDACMDIHMYAGLNISGKPGATYVLKYTTDPSVDFASWPALATNTLAGTNWFYLDKDSPFSPQRFYSVKLVP